AIAVYYLRRHAPGAAQIAEVERCALLARIAVERRRVEQKLESTEEHFRLLIEHASDLIVRLDELGTILYASPSAERVTGFTPSQLIGTDWLSRIHPDDLPEAWLAAKRVLAQPGVAPPAERRFRHRDGSWRVLEVVNNNQLDDPGVASVIVAARDITARKE